MSENNFLAYEFQKAAPGGCRPKLQQYNARRSKLGKKEREVQVPFLAKGIGFFKRMTLTL